MPTRTLNGIGVLVTRPRGQSDELIAEIEMRGGIPILFPSLEIVPRDTAGIEKDAASLSPADITVFISRNAVDHGIEYADGKLAAIGPTTAAAMERAGQRVDIVPGSGFDSEHLLAETAFDDVVGKTIRIIRGGAGREQLADSLSRRGANVEYLSTYGRRRPIYSAEELADLESRWRKGDVKAVVVMSVESLTNFRSLLPEWCLRQLSETPLVTPSARVLKEALKQIPGCRAMLAAGPQAGAICDSLSASQRLRQRPAPNPD